MIERTGLSLVPPSLNVAAAKPASAEIGADGVAKSFGNFLTDAIHKLEMQKAQTEQLAGKFAVGELADVHQLVIAAEKASLGLELTVRVRDKVIEAYQEVMRMQV